jgi:hypothetical protein
VPQSDHSQFVAFSKRILKALSKRMADADPEDLAELLELRNTVDAAIGAAVRGQRAAGFSWTDIARPLGMTRQAAQQRWGKLADADPEQS